jgi:hypothetical protein
MTFPPGFAFHDHDTDQIWVVQDDGVSVKPLDAEPEAIEPGPDGAYEITDAGRDAAREADVDREAGS